MDAIQAAECRHCAKPVRRTRKGFWGTTDPQDGHPWYCDASPDTEKRHEPGGRKPMTPPTPKTGSLVSIPAPYRVPGCTDRVTVVVEWVSPDDSWFTDTNGNSYRAGDAVVIPLGDPAVKAA